MAQQDEVNRLRAEVLELRGAVDAERLARLRLEGRVDDLLERFERLERTADRETAISRPPKAGEPSVGTAEMAMLAAAHQEYLREEGTAATSAPAAAPGAGAAGSGAAAPQPKPEAGTVPIGDAAYWERHRQMGSWQGEIRDEVLGRAEQDGATPERTRKIAAATEDDYWNQHL